MLALLFAVFAGCQSESSGGENTADNNENTGETPSMVTYNVDVSQSVIKWTGAKTEEPDTHNGEVKLKEGQAGNGQRRQP